MEKRENNVCSEQDVNNVLLIRYEAPHHKDSLRDENQAEFCKGKLRCCGSSGSEESVPASLGLGSLCFVAWVA